MNDFKRSVVVQCEKDILTDVNVDDILAHLVEKNVVNSEELRVISGRNQTKTAELLKILYAKTEGNWFEEFASALNNDYSWISKKLTSTFDSEATERLSYYHGRGNVPPLPPHNIRREKYVQPLQDKIRNLKRNAYLVVHGMSGLGKTNLVVDALNDVNLLEKSLNGFVYWISVGDFRNEELDELQCLQLQKKLCNMANLSINPQREPQRSEELLLELKRHFSLKPNNQSLLILDKVKCSKVIEILNIGCKILITSQYRDVVKDSFTRDFFEISEGFSERESVQLLKEFVLEGAGELAPPIKECAAKIHRMWKGHPMAIGLIGGGLSEIKEGSLRDVDRWKVYEKTSQRKDNGNVARRRSILEEQIRGVIEQTTNMLPSDFKSRFYMLAVLVEDANITNDVLKILWGVTSPEVEQTMNTFYRTSLVLRKYVDKLKQPVYGIHDIIVEYLKKSISTSELQDMHKDIMKKFHESCHGDFSELPEDSYIFSYLCHHVENAGEWNKYRDQFFSLRYLEKKLKATGPGDLMLDLQKYQDGLVDNNEKYCTKMEYIKKLVNESGWDIYQGDVSIVQAALLQPDESFLHDEAIGIASINNSSELYLYPNHTGQRPKDLKIDFGNVQAVSLVTNNFANLAVGRVLVYPDPDGLIAEIDMNYRLTRRTFREGSEVVMLKMSPLHDKFLSALENGTINIWSMTSESTSTADTPPPSLKQKSHQPFFESTRSTPCLSFKHKLRVNCASFSSDGRFIVSASADGVVCVWNLEEGKCVQEQKLHPSPPATACTFVCNDTMIVYGCADFYIYFLHLRLSQILEMKIDGSKGRLVTLLSTPGEGRELIVVQEKSVSLISWDVEHLSYRSEGHRVLELKNVKHDDLYVPRNLVKLNCAAFHQNHLVLGTSCGCWILFDVLCKTNCCPSPLGSEEIKAVDIVNSQVVLAQKSSLVMLWPEPNQRLFGKQFVSAHLGWNTRHEKPMSVHATATSDGNIQVFRDGKMTVNKLYPKTCFVRVCEENDHILIGKSDGVVALFDTLANSINELFRLPTKITFLSVTMYHKNYVYVATSKENDNSEKLVLQAKVRSQPIFAKINAPVVKVFVVSDCMIVVLQDCSILAWHMLEGWNLSIVMQGRVSAHITDASISEEKNTIVLSDLENCFHYINLIWPDAKKPTSLDSNYNKKAMSLKIPQTQDGDVVDGMGLSSTPIMDIVKPDPITIPTSSQNWCCSMSPTGKLVAIGHGECNVLVWDLEKKSTLLDFKVLPHRRSKVGHLQFSHHDVEVGKTRYKLILCVVTDCLSFYDLSFLLNDNSRIRKDSVPNRIGCVPASGYDIIEFSANNSFKKFCAYDISYSLFSWGTDKSVKS